MVARELEQILLEELGYAESPNLLHGDEIPWVNGRKIPNVESALFLKTNPIAYFSRFSDLDLDAIQQLHKNVWSQSKAPLLFVTLPHEIRIYNGYEMPPETGESFHTPRRLLQQLEALTDDLTARREIQQHLITENYYERIYLETGAFWNTSSGKSIKHQSRADKRLINSMGKMRETLTDMGLPNDLAYTLLGRSIFIRYLEDRGALDSDWIRQMSNGRVSSYQEALRVGRETTYRLFEQLSRHFNGDLFPVENVENAVTEQHLAVLLKFLSGDDLETGQLSWLPYNFEYIPIELISHIYDTFIGDRRASGAYYTPLILADFILEETMGKDVIRPDMTILDPACGSGIFLVGAYRRLIQAWRHVHGTPSPDDLHRLLQNNIFGVDHNPEAVRIAAFSLYLEILNHLSNEQIRSESFQFVPLQHHNLFSYDFFKPEIDTQFAKRKFDRIVGNLPWGRGTLTDAAVKWLKKNKLSVGGKQAAPAFMLRMPQFCDSDGEVAVLTSAKSSIFVTSKPHRVFREQILKNYDVRAVVNFSAMRRELFEGAVSPSVAFFYAPTLPESDKKLIYGVPKPSPLSQHLQAIVLDTTEIKFLDRAELLDFPELWKIALWGTPRDAALIKRLSSIPTLEQQSKNLGWREAHEGFQVGKSEDKERDSLRKPTPEYLKDIPFLPTEKFQPFVVNIDNLSPVKERRLYNPGDEQRFQGPLVLIHQSKCQAAYSKSDISYLASLSGITGNSEQKHILKWLVCVINSSLSRYYQFLTSTRWAIERANPLHKEYEEMPFLLPNSDDPRLHKLLKHFESFEMLLNSEDTFFSLESEVQKKDIEREIEELVYEIYSLHTVECQLIEDMLTYGIGFFEWAKRKNRKPREALAVSRPDVEMLQAYADVFVRTVISFLRVKDRALNATVYQNGAPLTVVSFDLVALANAQPAQTVTQPQAMRQKLRELDKLLLERKTPSMYMRRHVTVFDGDQVSLVRPSERRFWTQSQARADADAFLSELSSF